MSAQLYVITGLAFILLAGLFIKRKDDPMAFACGLVAIILIVCGPALSTIP